MILQAPLMLTLFLILPILRKILARAYRKRNDAATKLRGEREPSNAWKKGIAFQLGAFAALIFALAQPAWNPRPGPLQVQGRDLVIALDISRSMLATDVFPSRLDAAKISLHESLDLLQGHRIGLITFAGAASVRVPLTLDHHFVKYMLDHVQPSDADVGSTSLQAAIEKAIDVALSESKKGKQDILIFTDGEDHISDIKTTAEELRKCNARVLIIGLGDPLGGARVPAILSRQNPEAKADEKPNQWMQFKGEDVITKLNEEKLKQLSTESPNVTCHAARTRPFDLIALYHQMITHTEGIPSDDETQLVYTEGYPMLIALALLLWLLPLNKRLFPTLALLLLIGGCSPERPPSSATNYPKKIERGQILWTEAQELIEPDPRTALAILFQARADFLQAAMIQPGDREVALHIAGVSAQIRVVNKRVKAQEEAENDLQQKLKEAIKLLQILTQRENALAQQSQKLLRRRPPAPPNEKVAAVEPSRVEQTEITVGTDVVTGVVSKVQAVIQQMLAAAYGESNAPLPTEFDEALKQLNAAKTSQKNAAAYLSSESISWPQANAAFHSAARQMQEALHWLSDQNQGQESNESSEISDNEMDWEFDEEMEWSKSDMPSDLSLPMGSGQFQTDLQNCSLPIPNYTAEEILMEEAANMEQRAQQQSGRAGAKVEKNW